MSGSAETTAAALDQAINAIPREPPRDLFADEGGEPILRLETNNSPSARTATAFCNVVAEHLHQLTFHVANCTDVSLLGIDNLTSSEENWRASRRRDPSEAPLSGILIEELLPDEENTENKGNSSKNSHNSCPAAVVILLAAAQWGDRSNNTTFRTLERPWVTSSTRTTSQALLSALFKKVPLISLLPKMVDELRPVITAAAMHAATETSRLEPYIGPDTWERSCAMGQLAAAVQWLTRETLWQENDLLWQHHVFPVVTAAVQDPSPTVQNYALWTLHHIFTISSAKELAPWTQKLVEITRKAVIGCDEKVWPAAAAVATALALKLDNGGGIGSISSSSPAYNPQFITLFEALLDEGERHAHAPPRSIVWLQTIPLALFPLLGVQLTRYFRRLMPLLLEWCVSIHKSVRLGALRAVHAVVRATWPRIPAHAGVIWAVVENTYLDETTFSANPSEEIIEAAVEVAILLWQCGGETFQQQKVAAAQVEKEMKTAGKEGGGESDAVLSLLDRALRAVKSMEEEDSMDVNIALGAVKIEEL